MRTRKVEIGLYNLLASIFSSSLGLSFAFLLFFRVSIVPLFFLLCSPNQQCTDSSYDFCDLWPLILISFLIFTAIAIAIANASIQSLKQCLPKASQQMRNKRFSGVLTQLIVKMTVASGISTVVGLAINLWLHSISRNYYLGWFLVPLVPGILTFLLIVYKDTQVRY